MPHVFECACACLCMCARQMVQIAAAIAISAGLRGLRSRLEWRKVLAAIVSLQCAARIMVARKVYQALLKDSRVTQIQTKLRSYYQQIVYR